MQLLNLSGVGRLRIESAQLVGGRLVSDVLVQRAACLPLAQQEAQVICGNGNGRLGKVENLAGLEPPAPGARQLRPRRPPFSKLIQKNGADRHRLTLAALPAPTAWQRGAKRWPAPTAPRAVQHTGSCPRSSRSGGRSGSAPAARRWRCRWTRRT